MKVVLIAALTDKNIIASKGKIPWHSAEELQHFKITTTGFPIIMGRKTWDSIGKPLENRLNIIITNNKSFITSYDETKIFNSIEDAFLFCNDNGYDKVFVIGGSEIFQQTINLADELIISEIKNKYEGDLHFPEIDQNKWQELSQIEFTEFIVHYYIRKSIK